MNIRTLSRLIHLGGIALAAIAQANGEVEWMRAGVALVWVSWYVLDFHYFRKARNSSGQDL